MVYEAEIWSGRTAETTHKRNNYLTVPFPVTKSRMLLRPTLSKKPTSQINCALLTAEV